MPPSVKKKICGVGLQKKKESASCLLEAAGIVKDVLWDVDPPAQEGSSWGFGAEMWCCSRFLKAD